MAGKQVVITGNASEEEERTVTVYHNGRRRGRGNQNAMWAFGRLDHLTARHRQVKLSSAILDNVFCYDLPGAQQYFRSQVIAGIRYQL